MQFSINVLDEDRVIEVIHRDSIDTDELTEVRSKASHILEARGFRRLYVNAARATFQGEVTEHNIFLLTHPRRSRMPSAKLLQMATPTTPTASATWGWKGLSHLVTLIVPAKTDPPRPYPTPKGVGLRACGFCQFSARFRLRY